MKYPTRIEHVYDSRFLSVADALHTHTHTEEKKYRYEERNLR